MIDPLAHSTKARLLQAARKVYAERGVHEATTRRICAEAGANAAAVCYHFGGKDRLYAAVLDDHLGDAEARFPLNAGVSPSDCPRKRLAAYVRGLLSRLIGDGDEEYTRIGKLVSAELLDPSPQFREVMDRRIGPCHEGLEGIIREMLPGATAEALARCAASIEGQCLIFHSANSILQLLRPEVALRPEGLDRAADFIVEFSLGGIDRLAGGAS
jgi:AcrR family transcriptional regulator